VSTAPTQDNPAAADLLAAARAGDGDAFRALISPHLPVLHVHAYRMLGSLDDADEALQDALLSAWRALDTYQGQAPLIHWLYRITTTSSLKVIRAKARRPVPAGEIGHLQPYPDRLLDQLADAGADPAAITERRESVALAFITALQRLPARQRAALILRDVLGFSTSQVADILDSSEDSAASALKRARATMRHRSPTATTRQPPPRPGSPEERDLVDRFTRAYQDGDVAAVVALLTEDISVTMPPLPVEYHGRDLVARFLATTGLRPGRRSRLIPTRANGQPAFGLYAQDPQTGIRHTAGLLVLTLTGNKVCAMTGFDTSVPPLFGLPRTLPR